MGDRRRQNRIAAAAVVVLALVAVLSTRPAAAYPLSMVEDSLDWKIADADLIVVGRVVAVRWVAEPSGGGDPWGRQVNTVEVSETIKGPQLARLEYAGREEAIRPEPAPLP